MKLKLCLAFVLFYICTDVFAQSTAVEIETLLATDAVTYAQASRFVLEASEVLITSDPEAAFLYAVTRKWLPEYTEPDDIAQLGGISLLLMHSFNIEGGFTYRVSKTPHTAMRELMYRNVIQGDADAYMRVSGEQLIFYIGRLLTEREREAAEIARRAQERAAGNQDSKERLDVDSFDFGLLLDQYTSYGKYGEGENAFEYKAGLVPRVTFLLDDMGHFIASLGFTFGYKDEFYYVPEILRTEYSVRFGALGITVGRMVYTDPLGYIANGLFDGIQVTHVSPAGRFGLGVWYTGALYKKNTIITMTEEEQRHYDSPLVMKDFASTYFTPSRLLLSLDWEHFSIGELVQVDTALTGQIDLSKTEGKYHSQYLTLKAGVPFNSFLFEAGGSLEASQSKLAEENLAFNLAFTGELGIHYTLQSNFSSRLSFIGRYASGEGSKLFSAFVPLTTKFFGDMLQAKATGLTMLVFDYSARFIDSLGANITASYFIRSDLETPVNYSIISGTEDNGKLLGAELLARLVWSPFSDLQYNLGMRVFIPSLGNNWPDAKSVWRIDLSIIFAAF